MGRIRETGGGWEMTHVRLQPGSQGHASPQAFLMVEEDHTHAQTRTHISDYILSLIPNPLQLVIIRV